MLIQAILTQNFACKRLFHLVDDISTTPGAVFDIHIVRFAMDTRRDDLLVTFSRRDGLPEPGIVKPRCHASVTIEEIQADRRLDRFITRVLISKGERLLGLIVSHGLHQSGNPLLIPSNGS